MSFETRRGMVWLGLLAGVAFVAGCGQGPDTSGRPATVPAGGTVTYNGQPVDGASVVFAPEQGGKAAVGKTDASGNFTLMTFDPADGAVPGKYAVTVVKRTELQTEASENSEGAAAATTPKDLLPEKYGSPSTSGLTAEVAQGGENQFKFELQD